MCRNEIPVRRTGTKPIAPGAIGRRLNTEPIADPIAQRGHLRALQARRQVAGIAVPRIHFFIVRRRDPRVKLRADLAALGLLRGAEYLGGAVVGDDRPVNEIDGVHPRALEIALAFGERRDRGKAIAGARERRIPVEILLGVDRDPETRLLARIQCDHFRRGRICKETARRLHDAPLCQPPARRPIRPAAPPARPRPSSWRRAGARSRRYARYRAVRRSRGRGCRQGGARSRG